MPIFCVKSVKIYTGQKNLHWRRQPRQRQLSGMLFRCPKQEYKTNFQYKYSPIDEENGLRDQFWPLLSGFLSPVPCTWEKFFFFLTFSYAPILIFRIPNLFQAFMFKIWKPCWNNMEFPRRYISVQFFSLFRNFHFLSTWYSVPFSCLWPNIECYKIVLW